MAKAERANLQRLHEKWQARWEEAGAFKAREDPSKRKFYVLEMYPYPSGSGLHVGHARNYCIGDVYARFKRMQGFNVLYPMGYDSFGLPAENAAIKAKSHPKVFTEKAIARFKKQQRELGLSYDWSRVIASHTPEYYKWDQWIFLKMYEKGLVYKRKSIVNWCPKCCTVLANEQVHAGKCWRHEDTSVEVKDLEQWFFKITDYAEELLKGLDELKDWPEDVKIMQRNWMGRSEGTEIEFPIQGSEKKITVFTTRPDTFFGITFLVYAPEHPDVLELVKGTGKEDEVKRFIEKVVIEDRFTRTAEDKEKEGLFIGRHALNPVTGEKIPIYIANFVLYEYGTGAIIGVPAHDQRDFEFAKKYGIPLKVVINPSQYELNPDRMSRAYAGDGVMTNSPGFNGLHNREAMEEITKFLEEQGVGRKVVKYKLRDWLISRQRFWGCPIPIVYCEKCGEVPVPECELPVKLPEDFKFTNEQGNPLEHCEEFVNTTCPRCEAPAKRETDTMDTFVDSSWYFLRYCDPKNEELPFNPEKADYWMPIDVYIGGKEHATMHLIYFRFFTKFLRDLGLLRIDEPALKLFNQGMLHKGGVVMSKSKGNVVTQEEVAERYGIDTLRFFLLFVASPEKDTDWDDKGVAGSYNFLNKVLDLFDKEIVSEEIALQESKRHKAIKEVTEYIEAFKYNLALISIMEYANFLSKQEKLSRAAAETLLLLLAPFTPHLAEELWERLGNEGFISLAEWPVFDPSRIDLRAEAAEKLVETVRRDVKQVLKLTGMTKPKKITLFVAEEWKHVFAARLKKLMEENRNVGFLIKELLKEPSLKGRADFIKKNTPFLVRNPKRLPEAVLGEREEFEALSAARESLKKEFSCVVEVVRESEAEEEKARKAFPGKPSILIV